MYNCKVHICYAVLTYSSTDEPTGDGIGHILYLVAEDKTVKLDVQTRETFFRQLSTPHPARCIHKRRPGRAWSRSRNQAY